MPMAHLPYSLSHNISYSQPRGHRTSLLHSEAAFLPAISSESADDNPASTQNDACFFPDDASTRRNIRLLPVLQRLDFDPPDNILLPG